MKAATLEQKIFSLSGKGDFDQLAMDVFRFQYERVSVYRTFCKALGRRPHQVSQVGDIPFLPIQFFKTHKIRVGNNSPEKIFTSSGTSGQKASKHYVNSLKMYENSFHSAFREFYGEVENYVVLALLPSYLERKGSSLIYMAKALIEKSRFPESGFYLNDYEGLARALKQMERAGKKILLIGVSFALLDLIEREQFHLKHTIVMETGGM